MSTYGPRERRSNKEVARNMLICGLILFAIFVVSIISEQFVSVHLNGWNAAGRNWIFSLWEMTLRVAPEFAASLIVGAIIVNRLPERPQTSAE